MIRISSTSSASGSLRQVLIGEAVPLQCAPPHLARLLHPQKQIDQTEVRSPWRMPSTVTNYQRSPTIGGAPFPIRVRAEPTRNTNNAVQPSRKSSHPHSHNHTDVHARPRPRPLNVRARVGHSPGKYSSTIPSSCARISSKGQSRSSVVALMRLPLMR